MLKNKIVLVTGASSGIGRAVALVCAREGAKLVVSDVDAIEGEETAAKVRALGTDAFFIAADVGKPEDHKNLVDQAVAIFGRPDVACNNAGGCAGIQLPKYPNQCCKAGIYSHSHDQKFRKRRCCECHAGSCAPHRALGSS